MDLQDIKLFSGVRDQRSNSICYGNDRAVNWRIRLRLQIARIISISTSLVQHYNRDALPAEVDSFLSQLSWPVLGVNV